MGVLAKPIPFGDYFLLEKINTGGMAEVYKAKTFGVEGFERIVAIKKILPSIAEDTEFISMFIDEAKIAVQLAHANIVQIFDLGNIGGDYYIAMEYVSGHDMRVIFDRCVRSGVKLDIACVCYIVSKICEGLDYAHNKRDANGRPMNIIHRDISPQNILLGYDGSCKLIDFGIAKATNKSSATQVGILKGKFSYMSPEQVSGKAIDRRSDIFALGIVLFELLTMKRLFMGASDFETLEKIRKVEVDPPSLYNRDITADLEAIVLKALERDVDARYQTAAELQEALQRFMFAHNMFYSAKDLAAFCHSMFAQEIALEQKKSEFYRELTRDVLMQARKPASDLEDETSFYERHNVRRAAGLQLEAASGSSLRTTSKQEIYDELDDFEPPTGDIAYSNKQPHGVANPAAVGDIISAPVKAGRNAARRVSGGVRQSESGGVVVSRGHETRVSPADLGSSGRGPFILMVMLLLLLAAVVVAAIVFLKYDPENGEVEFSVYPEDVGARIRVGDGAWSEIDGGSFTASGLSVRGETGYAIVADGYRAFDGAVRAVSDRRQTVAVNLVPDTGSSALKFYVNADGAVVTVNGELLEPLPGGRKFEMADVAEGEYIVRVEKDGFKPEERTVTVKKGREIGQIGFNLRPAFVSLELRAEPYRADYEITNRRTGDVIKGNTGGNGGHIEGLPFDDEYQVVLFDGKNKLERTWKPSADADPSSPQHLSFQTTHNPDEAAAAARAEAERQAAEAARVQAERQAAAAAAAAAAKPVQRPSSPSSSSVGRQASQVRSEPAAPVAKPKPAEPAPQPAAPGVLQIASRPVSNIFINGRAYGSTPLKLELAPGIYTVVFQVNGLKVAEEKVVLGTGEVRKLVKKIEN